jgi:hypothetical protein
VQELFGKLHGRLQQSLAQAQQQQGSSSGSGRQQQQQQQHVRFDRWGDAVDDGVEEDYQYLDAGNRSPTYKASIRQQRNGSSGSSEWGVLRLLLDCQEAMRRSGEAADDATAAAGGQQAAGGQEGGAARQQQQQQQQQGGVPLQWQWGNGAGGNSGAAAGSVGVVGGSRKRERSERR